MKGYDSLERVWHDTQGLIIATVVEKICSYGILKQTTALGNGVQIFYCVSQSQRYQATSQCQLFRWHHLDPSIDLVDSYQSEPIGLHAETKEKVSSGMKSSGQSTGPDYNDCRQHQIQCP